MEKRGRENSHLLRVFAVAALLLVVITVVMSTVTLVQQRHVESNSKRIDMVVRRLKLAEHLDTRFLRQAAYRNCYRDMITRAEIHVVYEAPDAGKALSPSEIAGIDPGTMKLIAAGAVSRLEGQKRVRKQQPILDCEANLRGSQPNPLSRIEQDKFIENYRLGLLDPVSGIALNR